MSSSLGGAVVAAAALTAATSSTISPATYSSYAGSSWNGTSQLNELFNELLLSSPLNASSRIGGPGGGGDGLLQMPLQSQSLQAGGYPPGGAIPGYGQGKYSSSSYMNNYPYHAGMNPNQMWPQGERFFFAFLF